MTGVAAWLAAHRDEMIADLAEYVGHESSSDDLAALDTCLHWVRDWLDRRLGPSNSDEWLPREATGDVLVRHYAGTGSPVLLLAHYDTVWPTGTLADWPFQVDGDRMTGPGVFDMKAGLVQAVWAVRALDALGLPRPAFTLVLNGDEETGSLASSDVIVAEAAKARPALVFEASADGALKTARKGVGLFTVTATGEEAHAGLDPAAGAGAIQELAHQVLRLHGWTDLDAGTSVNVGVIEGGTGANVTAGRATARIDVRVGGEAERRRITALLADLRPVNPDVELAVTGDWNRPVFERTPEVGELFALARACAEPLGVDLREVAVGGASDGNFVVAAGIPVLDGLGAVGGGAHARTEHATISGMLERSALTAALLAELAVC
ncbi:MULTISPECIES: M20 family metallopeptidase [unclassified Saccharopolyspora]|uniref:M20 family metallopeptidase n=1 Tax=unclassified Saccharopolyspora TaxID=2646250 RepID=UPI001CD53E1B|nr:MULTISPECIES: M20 family metallopeptidase [unclassified Saccharopolyspora]MCA1185037.1 M20 family metallopeptidase [Saccharopolyspora sp. 6T]MCA1226256.1 M20 family metallopeptidase [Saccharopolyspora sp. 6M]